jgi:hypothetical protein
MRPAFFAQTVKITPLEWPDNLFCRKGAHYKQEQCVSLFPRPGNHMSAIFFVYYCQHAKLNIS